MFAVKKKTGRKLPAFAIQRFIFLFGTIFSHRYSSFADRPQNSLKYNAKNCIRNTRFLLA